MNFNNVVEQARETRIKLIDEKNQLINTLERNKNEALERLHNAKVVYSYDPTDSNYTAIKTIQDEINEYTKQLENTRESLGLLGDTKVSYDQEQLFEEVKQYITDSTLEEQIDTIIQKQQKLDELKETFKTDFDSVRNQLSKTAYNINSIAGLTYEEKSKLRDMICNYLSTNVSKKCSAVDIEVNFFGFSTNYTMD